MTVGRRISLAIARQLDASFAQALPRSVSIDLPRAVAQHERYVDALRQLVPVLELPALPDCPDGVFVEDTCLILDEKRALRCQPGHPSRISEVEAVRAVLRQLGLEVHNLPEETRLDGGDVLWTGQHWLVGSSARSSRDAAHSLQSLVPDRVRSIAVPSGSLHLKSIVTALDAETLVVPEGAFGDLVVQQLPDYRTIRLPDQLACNLVVINDTVLIQPNQPVLQQACRDRYLDWIEVDTSELARKDAALTCCSVLLSL